MRQHVSAMAFINQDGMRRDQLEHEYEDRLLALVQHRSSAALLLLAQQQRARRRRRRKRKMRRQECWDDSKDDSKDEGEEDEDEQRPDLQVLTCIDDRECSFRRLLEECSPARVDTFGVAGFFGLPVEFSCAHHGGGAGLLTGSAPGPPVLLAPDGAKALGRSVEVADDVDSLPLSSSSSSSTSGKRTPSARRRALLARTWSEWEAALSSPVKSLGMALVGFPVAAASLALAGFAPQLRHALKEKLLRAVMPGTGGAGGNGATAARAEQPTHLTNPFDPDTAAALLAKTFHAIGLPGRRIVSSSTAGSTIATAANNSGSGVASACSGFAPVVAVIGHAAASTNNPCVRLRLIVFSLIYRNRGGRGAGMRA
jgi:hypothetical protein